MDARAFEVEGHGGRPLPCVLHGAGSERAAVVLPGTSQAGHRLGGTPAQPDLHFLRALLLGEGYDVLEVWWDAESRPDDGREEWYRVNALAGVRAAGEERVRLLVGRSIGTIALSLLRDLDGLASLWVAPLTTLEPVRAALAAWSGPALIVAGDADEAYAPVPGAEAVVVSGGNHALAVGDAPASARALAGALEGVRDWLRRLP